MLPFLERNPCLDEKTKYIFNDPGIYDYILNAKNTDKTESLDLPSS